MEGKALKEIESTIASCTSPDELEKERVALFGKKGYFAAQFEELKKLGREDIVVIAGGVIPAQDYDYLYKAGVSGIFGPGTSVAKAACTIMEILLED